MQGKHWARSICLHLVLGTMVMLPLGATPVWASESNDQTISVVNENKHNNVVGGQSYATSDHSEALRNSITVTGSNIHYRYVYNYAQESGTGSVATGNNTITINGSSSVGRGVYNEAHMYSSAADSTADLTGNSITMEGNSSAGGYVYNAVYIEDGSGTVKATDNKIKITDSTVGKGVFNEADVIGGGTGTGTNAATASGNTIELTNADIEGYTYNGAYVQNLAGDAATKKNTITITGSKIGHGTFNEAHAFAAGNATVDNNKITVTATSTVTGNAYNGAYAKKNGNASNTKNAITVQNSEVKTSAFNVSRATQKGDATVDGSTIEVTDSKVGSGNEGGAVYNGADATKGDATVANSTITITNSTVGVTRYELANGYNATFSAATFAGTDYEDTKTVIKNNKTIIKNSTLTGAIGILAMPGTENSTTEITDNTIDVLQNSSVSTVLNEALSGSGASSVSITGNVINVEDSTIDLGIMLAAVWDIAADDDIHINNNTVNIRGKVNMPNGVLYGGLVEDKTGKVTIAGTNNTLNMYSKDMTVADIGYFTNYNFYLPTGTKAGDTMLTVTSSSGTDLTGGIVALKGVESDFTLNVGKRLI